MDPTMHMGVPGAPGQAPAWLAVSPEHSIALLGVLALPVLLVAGLIALRWSATRSVKASSYMAGIESARSSTHLAVLLMLITGVIHLVLVPVHLHDPIRAALFTLNGMAFVGISALAYTKRPWRVGASVLALATIGAYGFYLNAGLEDADLIGVFTKAIEGAALVATGISAVATHRDSAGDPGTPGSRKQHRSVQRTANNTTQPQEVLG